MKTLYGSYTSGGREEVSTSDYTEPNTYYEAVFHYSYIPDFLMEHIAPKILEAFDNLKHDIKITYIGIDTDANKLIVQWKDISHQVPILTIVQLIIYALIAIAIMLSLDRVYKIVRTPVGGIGFILLILLLILLLRRR